MTNNVALALNAVDWLTQDSDLIAVRAKNVEDPAIDVPSDVQAAEDAARTAQDSVVAAAQVGDAANAEKASKERDDALEKRKAALEAWEKRKRMYRWGNMVGIPLAFALFGVARWQLRQRRRRHLAA
ncbi:MAG: hypothetical protein R3A78_06450 [Polyangiales bacterium]